MPFPDAFNNYSFAHVAAEEYVFVAAYADLLRAEGWMVREVTTTRPKLLVSQPAALPGPTN